MRMPPYYRYQEAKRFFAGMAIGAIISWMIFLYIYGEWQEEFSMKIKLQEEDIQELINEKKIWQEDIEELNKMNQEKLTIQQIDIKITNYEKYKLDSFSVHEITEAVKEDVQNLITKDIETAYKSRELIKRAIENRIFPVNDRRYRLKIQEIAYFTTLSIRLTIQLE